MPGAERRLDRLAARDDLALVAAVREGLPVALVDEAVSGGRLTAVELDRLAVPRKTLAHRRRLGRLSPEQSDRFLRVIRTIRAAETTFGDAEKAATWLRRPTSALADHAPLSLLDTDAGARRVEALLGRNAHGIAA